MTGAQEGIQGKFGYRGATDAFKPWLRLQCSPYQAVTGKIYRLKQHFLPPATA